MNMTRRSFLKAAGLTVVAAAGASMFTGCGTFLIPEIKVTYQEVVSATDKTAASAITKNLKGWSDGKKVFTEKSSLFDIKEDTKDVSVADAKKALVNHLKDDGNKTITAKDIELVPEQPISYKKENAGYYTMTVTFCKKSST